MKLIALTGSIGSGKSTVAQLLAGKGAAVIDADQLAREAVLPNTAAFRQIAAAFGTSVLGPDGTLDRVKLGSIVFNDRAKLKLLEAIVHPEVRKLFEARVRKLREASSPLVVYAVPLLFESGMELKQFDAVLLVDAPEEQCLARVMQRDNIDRVEAEKRYQAQMPRAEKLKRAQFVIDNSGDLEQLKRQVETILATITTAL
ncbi:MAG: dephospho-CoA kinase [Oligoflexia bacterium]|nr:dephospho-CoA kinase [Oligoflexia bacterium]